MTRSHSSRSFVERLTTTCRPLHEQLDTTPANKIRAFGGDYHDPELSCVHATMARRDVAGLLATRVEYGLSVEAEAAEGSALCCSATTSRRQ